VQATSRWLSGAQIGSGYDAGRIGFAQLRHYTAEYQEWGNGPPLLLVPGLAGGCQLMAPLARALAEHFRVITYQLRGETDCFALRRRFGLPDLAADLVELLDWLCLERPAVLGVSFGGLLALELAARQPGRLRALAVQGAGARWDARLLCQVVSRLLSGCPLPPDSPFVNQFFNLFFGGKQRPEALFRFVTRTCWQTDQSVMAHRFRLAEQFDISGRLARIQVPTLVLAGDRDLLVSERSLNDLCRGLPQARRVDLPETGHLACVTQPRRMASEVVQFLGRLDS
jgi:pimeloyl-ACP methyl ester carboxylesterase